MRLLSLRLCLPILVAWGIGWGPSIAFARPRLSVARGVGASSCPDATTLQAQIEAILGRPALSDENSSVGFDVEISAVEEGFSATIRVSGSRQGQRVLQDRGPGCGGLQDALAISLAMLLDARETPEDPAASTSASAAPSPPPPPAPPAPSALPEAPRSSFAGRVWLGGGGKVGVLPSIRPALAGGVELDVGSFFGVGLDAFWLPAERISLEPGGVDVALIGGTARACGRWSRNPAVSLGGCASFLAGGFRASGSGYIENRAAGPGWFALGAGAFASGPLSGRLGWLFRLDGTWALREQRFFVDNVGNTPPLPRFGLGATLGLSVRLWLACGPNAGRVRFRDRGVGVLPLSLLVGCCGP